MVPISSLYEAHLTVSDLESSIDFYRDVVGLQLAHRLPQRHAAFFWVGGRERSMGAASVRTTFDGWIDYMHIVNVGGEWKIINVLWELTPEAWASRTDKSRSSKPSWPRGH
jgi:catechol 2,3-dioxygenase-like lactoylglutathione lyase family enzyme